MLNRELKSVRDFKELYGFEEESESRSSPQHEDRGEISETVYAEALMDELQKLKQTKDSLFDNPEIKHVLKENGISKNTFLSKFTILENNLNGVTSGQLSSQEAIKNRRLAFSSAKIKVMEDKLKLT